MSNYNIYPKQFRNSKIPIEKSRCFMLMPFDSQFDYIYGEIKKYLNDNDFVCNRADELFGSVPIMSNVLKEILKAHFVIADLSGHNANVFYELGIAHSFKDAHNIILVAQRQEDIPFDIRHLSTIVYSEGNIKHLTSSILKTIKDNSYYYSFYEALQKKSIINLIHDDKDTFLESIQQYLGSYLPIATGILEGNSNKYSASDIKKVLDSCLGILYETSASSSKKNVKGIMRILSVILSECEEYEYSRQVMSHLLYENKLENYPLGQREIISLQAELAITLASNKVYFDEVMNWIISYFSKSKSATVDLNRYSLERFLLTSKDLEVDNIIANSVLHRNNYVREHMADIAGEKSITQAISPLLVQLKREENIYASSSIITSLGKLKDLNAYSDIVDWFNLNEDKIIRTQHFFILKHIFKAFLKLDPTNEYTLQFEKQFQEHIGPSALF